jgi:chromosome segregation ATPase
MNRLKCSLSRRKDLLNKQLAENPQIEQRIHESRAHISSSNELATIEDEMRKLQEKDNEVKEALKRKKELDILIWPRGMSWFLYHP